jgi:hypothetical protein
MYRQEHFNCCHAEQRHYSKLLREKPHLKQSISDIMNGKYSGSDKELFMYHPYSPTVQRELRICHVTQVIPLLAKGFNSPTETNPNEGHHTMSYAIDAYKRGQGKLKLKYRDKVSGSTQVRRVLPNCVYDTTAHRFQEDNDVTRNKTGLMKLQSQIDNGVHHMSSFETNSQGCSLVMNLKEMERVVQSVVPLCKVSNSYHVSFCDDSDLTTHKVLW